MRRAAGLLILLATVQALAAASARGVPPPSRSLESSAPIRALSVSEFPGQVAFVSGCWVRVWLGRATKTLQLDRTAPCSRASGIHALSINGRTVTWATSDGTTQTLWMVVSSPVSGRFAMHARRLVAGKRLLVGEGRGNWVPYAVGNTVSLAGEDESGRAVLRGSFESPSRPLWLSRTAGGIAVLRADGLVTVVDEQLGEVRASYAYRPGVVRAAKLYGTRLVVLRDEMLDVYDDQLAARRTFRLPRARSYGDAFCGHPRCVQAELRLADVYRDLVVYVRGREIHVLRLSDRRDRIVREPATGPVEAQIEGDGLTYSAGRRLTFVPMWLVTSSLAR
jgi:hypothetical protein